MARSTIKNSIIDNSISFCYAKTDKLAELEELINGPNSVDAVSVGERCYADKLYEAAKILFTSVKNNAKIASCLVKLG
jgi:clathrin heavy chain